MTERNNVNSQNLCDVEAYALFNGTPPDKTLQKERCRDLPAGQCLLKLITRRNKAYLTEGTCYERRLIGRET